MGSQPWCGPAGQRSSLCPAPLRLRSRGVRARAEHRTDPTCTCGPGLPAGAAASARGRGAGTAAGRYHLVADGGKRSGRPTRRPGSGESATARDPHPGPELQTPPAPTGPRPPRPPGGPTSSRSARSWSTSRCSRPARSSAASACSCRLRIFLRTASSELMAAIPAPRPARTASLRRPRKSPRAAAHRAPGRGCRHRAGSGTELGAARRRGGHGGEARRKAGAGRERAQRRGRAGPGTPGGGGRCQVGALAAAAPPGGAARAAGTGTRRPSTSGMK